MSDTKQRIKTLLQKSDESSCLKEIIAMLPAEVDDELRSMAEQKGISLVTFEEVIVSAYPPHDIWPEVCQC